MKSRCSGVVGLLTWSESPDFCDLRCPGKALAFVWPDKLNQESHPVKLSSLFTLFHPPLTLLFLFPLPLFFFAMTLFVLSFSARPVT